MIKNNIQSFFSNKNNATIFIVALFFVIWQNPSEQKMKNSALDYIIAQNSNISKILKTCRSVLQVKFPIKINKGTTDNS